MAGRWVWEGDLQCFEADRARALSLCVHARVSARASGTVLEWNVDDPRRAIVWHSPAQDKHALWKTTCFELFAGEAKSARYVEWNVAPSGQFNRYAFERYRERRSQEPDTTVRRDLPLRMLDSGSGLLVVMELPEPLRRDGTLGLSMVMETASAGVLHWAIRHGQEKPDFHLQSLHLQIRKGRAWNSD